MAIVIEPEPDSLNGGSGEYEDCIFCGYETIHWNKESNRPVCPLCSVVNEPEDITDAPFNY
jgi:hypothetical protein